MENITLAFPRLVRNDPIMMARLGRTSSQGDSTTFDGRTAAPPVFNRCASAENSAGWVTHDALLALRHFTRRKRGSLFVVPKLMSSFDDLNGGLLEEMAEEHARPAHQEIKHHDVELAPAPSAASAAFTPTSSSADVSRE